MVLGEFGVEIKPRTIQRAIQEGRIGVSPKKMGPQGYLPPKTFDHLTTAFESYIKIMQLKIGNRFFNTGMNIRIYHLS